MRSASDRWTVIRATPDDWARPCWTVARGATLVYVGPCDGPAAHIHERTAHRAAAQLNAHLLPTADAKPRRPVQSRAARGRLHGAAHIRSPRHTR